ncbi:hypothetical protein [Rhizobium tropici]|uniref:hypothetical protein n=1 Tax=Rhizobium tropici TaxID=398 RepID=UPI0002A70012|nr:hypothetical protein [Rhizobium tropici]AGB71057.1 hypothetical protein RTCIAT899_CH08335 [Rhizobium tropici CIAT 899]TGE97053.1 hypothetical protein C9417_15595 [Rhizobium sp. SEMIA 4088]
MKQVTEDQFDIVDDVTVIHRPTRTHISTYRYKDPSDIGDLMVRAGIDTNDFNLHDIRAAAMPILRRLAAERS